VFNRYFVILSYSREDVGWAIAIPMLQYQKLVVMILTLAHGLRIYHLGKQIHHHPTRSSMAI